MATRHPTPSTRDAHHVPRRDSGCLFRKDPLPRPARLMLCRVVLGDVAGRRSNTRRPHRALAAAASRKRRCRGRRAPADAPAANVEPCPRRRRTHHRRRLFPVQRRMQRGHPAARHVSRPVPYVTAPLHIALYPHSPRRQFGLKPVRRANSWPAIATCATRRPSPADSAPRVPA
jgi:hypothetical protein